MTVKSQTFMSSLDGEWVDLILTAREMGISIDEIRYFLRKGSLNEYMNSKKYDTNE